MENEILKTSSDWLLEPEYSGYVIMDPDGWDRTNYDYSFNVEKISKNEFEHRLKRSTIMVEFEYHDNRTPIVIGKLSDNSAPGQALG